LFGHPALFDEEDDAVKDMIPQRLALRCVRASLIGICGQAPSDRPGSADWLVQQGIASVSLNADPILSVRRKIHVEEQRSMQRKGGAGLGLNHASQF